MGEYVLYKHLFPNGKIYIGITCQKPELRWGYEGKNYRTQIAMNRAIQKYGWNNIKHEILLKELDVEEAMEKEKEYISLYDSANPKNGYNNSPGGNAFSEDMRKRKSEQMKGVYLGAKHPMYGKHHSEKVRKRLSECNKGKVIPTEVRRKIGKRVICINTLEIFGTCSEASRKYNINISNISACCLNKRKSAGIINNNKAMWMYYEDYLKLSQKDKLEYRNNILNKTVKYKNKSLVKTSKRHGNKNKGKAVICINNNKIFNTVSEAEEWAGIGHHISQCCNGKRKTAGKDPVTGEGLKWMYYEDYIFRENEYGEKRA